MKVTAKLFKPNQDGNIKAFGSITIEDAFAVQIKVIESVKGAFVSFPNYKTKDGEWKDTAFPITKDARNHIIEVVMAEYDKLLGIKEDREQTEQEIEDEFPF